MKGCGGDARDGFVMGWAMNHRLLDLSIRTWGLRRLSSIEQLTMKPSDRLRCQRSWLLDALICQNRVSDCEALEALSEKARSVEGDIPLARRRGHAN